MAVSPPVPDPPPPPLLPAGRAGAAAARCAPRRRGRPGPPGAGWGRGGIGKTALGRALAAEATARGAVVLTGGCYDLRATPPYGPWREALAGLPSDEGLPPPRPRRTVEDDAFDAWLQTLTEDEFELYAEVVTYVGAEGDCALLPAATVREMGRLLASCDAWLAQATSAAGEAEQPRTEQASAS